MPDGLTNRLTTYYRDWFDAITDEGTGSLDSMLAAEWSYTNYDGLVRGKGEYLVWVAEFNEPVVFVGPYDIRTRRYGDVALVLGGYRVLHPPGDEVLELRFSGAWLWRDHRWQCLLHHNSPVDA